ncbi:carbohydrate porin [Emcibacter sp.]|uniref:carbohydrate porin n=1 Tax=Emcibacter sp. TaxID=1979954 RepID=UPI003A90AA36
MCAALRPPGRRFSLFLAGMALKLAGFFHPALAQDNDRAIDFSVLNTMDIAANVSGGVERDIVALYNLDITAELDAAAAGIEGGTLFVYGLINNVRELAPLVGDLQVTSNIDNSEVIRLYEFWYQQEFGAGFSLRVGLYDLNSEFDAIDTAGLFLNSSHGIGPDFSQSGENGPSIFPTTSLALRLDYAASETLTLRAAVLDAIPNDPDHPKSHKIALDEGALLVGEADIRMFDGNWRLVAGGWHYTSRFDPIDERVTGRIGGNSGIYAFIEGQLADNLSGWVRGGLADQDINQLGHYIGGGLVLTGPFHGRPEDQLGLAVAIAGNGSVYRDWVARDTGDTDHHEIAWELTYRAEVTDWLTLQPDIQYVQNPGTNPDLDDALVIGIRLEIGGSF